MKNVLLVAGLLAGAAAAQPIDAELRRKTFDAVWTTVDRGYWDPKFGGVDWSAVRDRYAAKLDEPGDTVVFHELLNRMTGEIGASHFKVAAPGQETVIGGMRLPDAPPPATVGLDARWIEGELVVIAMGKGSAAERAGMARGFVIEKIGGKTPLEVHREARRAGGFALRDELEIVRSCAKQIDGPLESVAVLTVRDLQDERRVVEIPRSPRPEPQLVFEAKKLADGRGYIRFNLFAGNLATQFRRAMEKLSDTAELVLDLRGNRGGAGNLAAALAHELSARPGSLGQMKFRNNAQPMAYPGTGDQAYGGRITVWTDEWTGSTAEILARGLQTNRGAVVVGSVTAGAVLPSIVRELPSGGLLQYPIANYLDVKGEPLEGRGVKPDVEVRWRLADLRNGRDAWAEAQAAR